MTQPTLTEAETWPVTPAREVKHQHTALYERHAKPRAGFSGYYQRFIDTERANHPDDPTRTSFMFHPIHHKDPDRGKKLVSYIGSGLRDGRTYQVTAEMIDAVNGMYQATRDKVNHLETSDLISPAGFAWLDKPWQHTDINGKRVAVRAVSWAPTVVRWSNDQVTDGTRVCQWSYVGDFDDYAEEHADTYAQLYREMGDLVLLHVYTVAHGVRFLYARKDGTLAVDPTEADILVERPNGADDAQSWLHALWMLLDSEITVSSSGQLDRAARRRSQHAGLKYDDVQVITLRRARHAETTGDHEPVSIDWSCRWMVQGHWRHVGGYADQHHHFVPSQYRGEGQVICQTCGTKGAWVRPYVKGPDGKPMRHVEHVWRLSR